MSVKVDVFMPLFVKDYLAATADLSIEEHGAYTMLLYHLWDKDGSLPYDHDRLARLCRMSRKRWDFTWEAIARFFVVDVERGVFSQKRVLEELDKAKERKAAASENGAKGAKARWQPHSQAIAQPFALALAEPKATLMANHVAKNDSLPAPLPLPAKTEKKADNAHSRVLVEFCNAWKSEYREDYIPTPADKSQLGRLMRELGAEGIDLLPQAFGNYLADRDPFVAENQRHSLRFFCTNGGFNKYRTTAKAPASRKDVRVGHVRAEGANYGPSGDQEF